MSQRVQLNVNPASHLSFFGKVDHGDVQRGDLYRGSRDPSKWYQNTEGQGCVDFWRTYYRPVDSALVTVTPMGGRRMSHVNAPPGSRGAATAAEPAGSTLGGPSAEHEEDVRDGIVVKSVEHGEDGTLKVMVEMTITKDSFSEILVEMIQNKLGS